MNRKIDVDLFICPSVRFLTAPDGRIVSTSVPDVMRWLLTKGYKFNDNQHVSGTGDEQIRSVRHGDAHIYKRKHRTGRTDNAYDAGDGGSQR